MKFELDFDGSTKKITAAGLFLLATFGVYCLKSGYRETLLFTFLALAVMLLFLMMPTSVEVENNSADGNLIKVNRVLGSTRIRCRVKEVEMVEKLDRGLLIGTAGLFGWYGVFIVNGETALVYSRKRRDLVMLKAERNYVFGVRDAEGFLSVLNRQI